MKRFTETEKWNDSWFRKLTPRLKCLWLYLCDICDPSGVFDVDWELACFRIGEQVSESDLKEFGARLQEMPHKKFLIVKFIPFQYGKLSIQCRGQRPVFQSITRNGLIAVKREGDITDFPIGYAYPIGILVDTHGDTHKTRQDSTGQDPISTVPQSDNPPNQIKELSIILMKEYRRGSNEPFSYFEETAMTEIVRLRKGWKTELDQMLAFRAIEPQYFPKSITGLLESWQKTLDRTRGEQANKSNLSKINGNGSAGGENMPMWRQEKALLEAIEKHPANPSSVAHNPKCSPEQKEYLRQMKEKLRTIREKLTEGIMHGP